MFLVTALLCVLVCVIVCVLLQVLYRKLVCADIPNPIPIHDANRLDAFIRRGKEGHWTSEDTSDDSSDEEG